MLPQSKPDWSRISTRIKMNLDENQNESRRESNRISTRIKMNLGENQNEFRRESSETLLGLPCDSMQNRRKRHCNARIFTAKTQREARLNPSETDLPCLCEAYAMPDGCYAPVASALAMLAFSGQYFRWLCHGRIWPVSRKALRGEPSSHGTR